MGYIGDLYLIMVLQTPFWHPKRPNWVLSDVYSESGDKTLPEKHFSWKNFFWSKMVNTLATPLTPIHFSGENTWEIYWTNMSHKGLAPYALSYAQIHHVLDMKIVGTSKKYVIQINLRRMGVYLSTSTSQPVNIQPFIGYKFEVTSLRW